MILLLLFLKPQEGFKMHSAHTSPIVLTSTFQIQIEPTMQHSYLVSFELLLLQFYPRHNPSLSIDYKCKNKPDSQHFLFSIKLYSRILINRAEKLFFFPPKPVLHIFWDLIAPIITLKSLNLSFDKFFPLFSFFFLSQNTFVKVKTLRKGYKNAIQNQNHQSWDLQVLQQNKSTRGLYMLLPKTARFPSVKKYGTMCY